MNKEIAERISILIDNKNYNAIKKELCDIYTAFAFCFAFCLLGRVQAQRNEKDGF